MQRLTIFRFGDGDAAVERAKDMDAALGDIAREHGGLMSICARDGDDVLLINLWSSAEGSESMARDPRVLERLKQHGFDGPPPDRQHFDVAYARFAEERAGTTS
jgi:hypothetical protein